MLKEKKLFEWMSPLGDEESSKVRKETLAAGARQQQRERDELRRRGRKSRRKARHEAGAVDEQLENSGGLLAQRPFKDALRERYEEDYKGPGTAQREPQPGDGTSGGLPV